MNGNKNRRWLRMWLTVFLCFMMGCLLTGCKSNIDNRYQLDYKTIELANIQQDDIIFQEIEKVYQTNMKAAKTNEEKSVVCIKYLDDIYQLTNNRYDLDIDILSVFSDDYIDYIAICQVYDEAYLQEMEIFIEDKELTSKEYILENTKTGYMLKAYQEKLEFFQTQYGGD